MVLDERRHWWLPGFAAAFLVVGVPYWSVPYDELDLPGALVGAGASVVALAAGLTRVYSGRHWFRVATLIGAAVPALAVVRVIIDVARDPTSHNLWPFELVISALIGGATASVGALLGSAASRLLRTGSPP